MCTCIREPKKIIKLIFKKNKVEEAMSIPRGSNQDSESLAEEQTHKSMEQSRKSDTVQSDYAQLASDKGKRQLHGGETVSSKLNYNGSPSGSYAVQKLNSKCLLD